MAGKEPSRIRLLWNYCGRSARLCWALAVLNLAAVVVRGESSVLFVVLVPVLVLFPIVSNLDVIVRVLRGEARRYTGRIADVLRPMPGRHEKRLAIITMTDGESFRTVQERGLACRLEKRQSVTFLYLETRREEDPHTVVQFLQQGEEQN